MEPPELSCTTGGDAKRIVQPIWKKVWHILTKLNTHSTHSAVPLLSISPGEMKTYTHTKIWTLMFSMAYEESPKIENNPKALSREWINKLWYTHTMEYYSALKRNELAIYEMTQTSEALCWMKDTRLKRLHNVWFHDLLAKAKLQRQKTWVVAEDLGLTTKGQYKGILRGWWNVAYLYCGSSYMTVNVLSKLLNYILKGLFKSVNYILINNEGNSWKVKKAPTVYR